MPRVDRLVYALFEVKSLSKWREYMATMYGLKLQPSRRAGEFESVIDSDGCRLIFREGTADDVMCVGWQASDLDGLKAQLAARGSKAEWMSDDYVKDRGAGRVLRSIDPTGCEIDVVDTTASHNPFTPADHGLEYKTGELGFGHLTFGFKDIARFEAFYTEGLGMLISDRNEITLVAGLEIRAAFYRSNPRHHSIACADIQSKARRLNHFMLEVPERNAVGVGYERVVKARIPIAHHIGVHPNDNLFTFYALSPSGFETELGAEGRLLKDTDPEDRYNGFSIWGHEMPPAHKARMLKMALSSKYLSH